MRGIAATVIFMALIAPVVSSAQELSTEVFPSEDELLEALQLGDISFPEFIILREIITHGLDSTQLHLLDEIPNLAFFLADTAELVTTLQREQQSGFVTAAPEPSVTGFVRYRYYSEMERDGRAQYRTTGQFALGRHFDGGVRIDRDFTGPERVTRRWLRYQRPDHPLREIVAGNFTRRFGSGSIIGYRGKLLDFSRDLDRESALFPDYGGSNGAYVQAVLGQLELQSLASMNRDNNHRLVTTGAMATWRADRLVPSIILGINRLKNRLTDTHLTDIKYGLHARYRYSHSYVSWELSGQAGERTSFGTVIVEGRHHFDGAELRYAAWLYDEDFIDISAGSKAGNLNRTNSLDRTGFSYSDKRSGQEGGLVKSIVQFSERLQLVNSLLFAGRNRDTANVQLLAAVSAQAGAAVEIRFDYLNRTRKRVDEIIDRRLRVETRIRTGQHSIRSYIAYNTQSRRRDRASLFVNVRADAFGAGKLDLWSNLAHFDFDRTHFDYWYGYMRMTQPALNGVTVGVKISHRFERGASEEHRMVIMLELEARW